ncbi:AI-2E family transporter [Acetobacterium fimetarium]|uniref:AI-2E family transporter n=1 Tax=Acetobacterium fimetarium TaxID=52691 RepID=UPI00164A48FD|nr:AI-2E family transporter [Acetobacterium fimetarium]
MQDSSKKKRLLILNLMVLLIIGIIVFIIWPTFAGMFMPFLIAIILAYLLNPLVGFFEQKGLGRILSVIIVFVLMLAIVVGTFMSFVPTLITSIAGMISNIPDFISQMQQYNTELSNYITNISNSDISKYVNLEQALGNIVKGFGSALQQISNAIIQNSGQLMNIIIIPLVTIFLLMDKEFFINGVMYLVPLQFRSSVLKMCCDIDLVIGGFIKGQGLTSLVAGIATGICAIVLDIPYASIIGVVAGVTTMVPYFGPVVGMIVIVLMVLFTKPVMIIPILIAIGVVQVVCGNFLAPALMSGNVGLHPVFIIFSIFFFGALFGGLGMIMAVPLAGTIKVIGGYIISVFASREETELKSD